MTTPQQVQIRASDAEREVFAARIQQAGSEGRLTMAEVEERLGQVYAAQFRRELEPLVTDLPRPDDTGQWPRRPAPARAPVRQVGGFPIPLVVHAVIAALISTIMIVRWSASDAQFFWPLFPMFWLWGSLAVHARIRLGRRRW